MARTSYFTGFPLNENQSVYVEDILRQFGELYTDTEEILDTTITARDQAQAAAQSATSSENIAVSARDDAIVAKDEAQQAATQAGEILFTTEGVYDDVVEIQQAVNSVVPIEDNTTAGDLVYIGALEVEPMYINFQGGMVEGISTGDGHHFTQSLETKKVLEAYPPSKEPFGDFEYTGTLQIDPSYLNVKGEVVDGIDLTVGRALGTDSLLDDVSLVLDLLYVGSSGLEITHINPNGDVVQGINKTTGLPVAYPEGPDVRPDLDLITVRRTPSEISIHFPQTNGNYMLWGFQKFVNPEKRVDVWQMREVKEVDSTEATATVIGTPVDSGQVEVALRRAEDGGSFRIGGNAHGNDEKLSEAVMLVDGVAVPISGTDTFTCRRLEFIQASQLLHPDDSSNFAKRYTRWVFSKGELELSNTLVIEQEIEFSIMYLTMLSVRRDDGDITHSAVREPLWYPVMDVAGAHSDSGGTASFVKTWGDRYSAEVEILDGWDRTDRRSWISTGLNRNKLYFDFTGHYTPPVGEVLHAKSRLKVTVHGDNQ